MVGFWHRLINYSLTIINNNDSFCYFFFMYNKLFIKIGCYGSETCNKVIKTVPKYYINII